MTDHVRSLYTLVAPLSNLTSSEAQLISGNLTEVILPIVQPLVVSQYTCLILHWCLATSVLSTIDQAQLLPFTYRMLHMGKGFMSMLSTVQHLWLQFPHSTASTEGLSVLWSGWDLPMAFISWRNLEKGTLSHRTTLASNTPALSDHIYIYRWNMNYNRQLECWNFHLVDLISYCNIMTTTVT